MRKRYVFIILVMIVTVLVSVPTNFKTKVYASSPVDTLNYVSLGDSIAEGYGLSGFSSKGETDFVADSYAYLFKDKLEEEYANVNAISYAKSGDDTSNFLAKLNNTAVKNKIANADIITICIGANDILLPAIDNLFDFVLYDDDITPALDQGLSNFSTNFVTILNKLNQINPTAKKIFTNVYNPFREFMFAQNDLILDLSFIQYTIPASKFQEIGKIAEDYIAGSSNGEVVGLNQRMKGFIEGIDAISGQGVSVNNNNCYYLDSKQIFDAYTGNQRLVNADILDYDTLDVTFSNMESVVSSHIDPHPTVLGHEYLYGAFADYFDNNFLLIDFDFNGGLLNGVSNDIQLVKTGVKLIEPTTLPTKTGYRCSGWSYMYGGQPMDWNFNSTINSDMTISAKWTRQFVVSFDSAGGTSVSAQTVDTGSKVIKPQDPQKTGSTDVFAGWYYYNAQNQLVAWDFNNDIVTGNVTLVALWTELFVVSFNSSGGTSINEQSLSEGSKVTKPQDPQKSGSSDIFVGWYYYNNSNQLVLWDFESNVVTKSLTLIAKWVNSVCLDSNLLMQVINDIQSVEFSIDIEADIQWYVNNVLQAGQTEKTFVFTPEEVGEYNVYCTADGTQTMTHTVVVQYLLPTSIIVDSSSVSKNTYNFSVQNGNYIDASKCVWYAKVDQSDESEVIGTGISIEKRFDKNCSVFAVYDNQIISNYITIEVPISQGNDLTVFCIIMGVIILFVTLILFFTRIKYKSVMY